MARLTNKQEGFAQDFVKLQDSTASYRNHYNCANMSDKTVHEAACRLRKKPHVAERIKELEEEVKKIAKREFDLDAKWLLKRLYDEAQADIADLYRPEGGLKPVHEWPDIWRKGLVAGIDVEQQYLHEDGEKIPDGYITKIKLSDRIKRLELIGKHVDIQAFLTRKELTGAGGGPIEVKQRSDIDIARRLAFLLTAAAEKIDADDKEGSKN